MFCPLGLFALRKHIFISIARFLVNKQGFRMLGFASVLVQESGIGPPTGSLAKMVTDPLW